MENIAKNVEELCIDFIDNLQHHKLVYSQMIKTDWNAISDVQKEKQREAKKLYQRYYLVSKELVKEFIPSKSQEFERCYGNDFEGVFYHIESNIIILKKILMIL